MGKDLSWKELERIRNLQRKPDARNNRSVPVRQTSYLYQYDLDVHRDDSLLWVSVGIDLFYHFGDKLHLENEERRRNHDRVVRGKIHGLHEENQEIDSFDLLIKAKNWLVTNKRLPFTMGKTREHSNVVDLYQSTRPDVNPSARSGQASGLFLRSLLCRLIPVGASYF